jgi:glucan phosphoethanolaminetransferase (alkaline phosphatase superfamily)
MNAARLHLLVNHLPVIGFPFGLILLVATILRQGDRGLFAAAVLVVVISGAGGLAAYFTGEPAKKVVEHLADVPKALIETHEEVASIAIILALITTLLAIVLSFVTLRREGRIGVIPLSILLVATVVTCGAMFWTGSTGGKIRHSEIRDSISTTPSSGVRGND